MRHIITILLVLLISAFIPLDSVYALACNIPGQASGNVLVTAACAFANTIDGPDNAGGSEGSSANTAQIRLNAGLLTVNGTQTIVTGTLTATESGSMFINTGATIKIGNGLWVSDTDADGWTNSLTTYYFATAAARRRKSLMRGNSVDACTSTYDTTNVCYSYSQSTYYSQTTYYSYSQSGYYSYSQSGYYSYSQGAYYSLTGYYHIFWPSFTPN